MSRGAGEIAVTVSADVDYSVDIPEDAASWLRYSGLKTRAIRPDELVFHCDRNEGESARSAVVGFVNKAAGIHEKVVIFQEGIVHTLQTHSVGNRIKIVIMGDGFTKDDLTASEGEAMSSFDKWADRTMKILPRSLTGHSGTGSMCILSRSSRTGGILTAARPLRASSERKSYRRQ